MALNRTPTLEERIQALRAEVDAFIDARVEIERGLCPGVPPGMLRNLITAHSGGCQCAAYLAIKQKDVAA